MTQSRLSIPATRAKAEAMSLVTVTKDAVRDWRSRDQEIPTHLSELPGLSAEAKLLYCRVLVSQARHDSVLDPREVANLYLFASASDLDQASTVQLRSEMTAGSPDEDAATDGSTEADAIALTTRLAGLLDEDRCEPVMTSLVQDLVWISRVDGTVGEDERARIAAIAKLMIPGTADDVVPRVERLLKAREERLTATVTTSRLERRAKGALAAAVGLVAPISTLSRAGSVPGLSATGITSGLAALGGYGRRIGQSRMTAGVGTLIVLGVAAYGTTRYVLGTNERERERRHEFLMQEVIKQHQEAITDLAEDASALAGRMGDFLPHATRNEERLAALRADLASFQLALADLRGRQHELAAGALA